MNDLISRKALLAEYDRVHIGKPGKARMLIEDAPAVCEWIPVSEQEEPTENGTYLCHGYWFGSRKKQTETAEFFGEWDIANNFILTHWMPLPEPSKEEE